MSKSSPSPPPAPNPAAAVQAQAEAQRISQFTPQGNLLYGTVGPGGGFDQREGGHAAFVEETPFQEEARLGGQGVTEQLIDRAQAQAAGLPTSPIDFEGLPEYRSEIDYSGVGAIPTADDFSEDARRVEESTYERGMGLLNPQLELQERRLRQRLIDQGLPMGGEAYTGELDRYARNRDEMMSNLALDAVQAGRAEQSRLYGQALTSRGAQIGDQLADIQLQNAARGQGFGERSAVRANQFNELAALLGGQQVQPAGLANFLPPGNVDALTPLAMQNQNQMAAYQAAQQQRAGQTSGMFGLGNAAILGAILKG